MIKYPNIVSTKLQCSFSLHSQKHPV